MMSLRQTIKDMEGKIPKLERKIKCLTENNEANEYRIRTRLDSSIEMQIEDDDDEESQDEQPGDRTTAKNLSHKIPSVAVQGRGI